MERYVSIHIESGSAITDVRYYRNVLYPEIPATEEDIYVIATVGDRLDTLAEEYYRDNSLWWIISSANRLPGNSLYLTSGTQIRIPTNTFEIIDEFIRINQLR